MGGCRCYFRQCHVSNAKFQGMHYFRFPLKDSERYKKWREYSKMEHMLNFSEIRRKNIGICARHFRTECFMNYKMDRLVATAVPTIMRLSCDHALDFELDIEDGILVTLEKTTLKHLIPPNGFESPLCLENDHILLIKLSELQGQQYSTNFEISNVAEEHVDANDALEERKVLKIQKPLRNLVNSVEILETIQVIGPNLKRKTYNDQEKMLVTYEPASNKKCRILNSSNYMEENEITPGTSNVLGSQTLQIENCNVINSSNIDLIESFQMDNTHEFVNNENQLLATNEADFSYSKSEDEEDTEYFVEKDDIDIQYELPLSDSDSTIVQLKSDRQMCSPLAQDLEQQIFNMQNQLAELKRKNQDFETLQVKHSLLQTEYNELKDVCKQYEDANKKLNLLQNENNSIKKTLKDYEMQKNKQKNYCEENKKLKEKAASVEILKSELLSRKQETKDLKKLLETLSSNQTEEQNKIKQFDSELENNNEIKYKEEIHALKNKIQQLYQQLEIKETNLKDIMIDVQSMTLEKDRLSQDQIELKQSIDNIQNQFDLKQNEYRDLQSEYDDLQQKNSTLEQKYWKLQVLQDQVATVSTSLEQNKKQASTLNSTSVITANSLTKAQLFNGIKRYISASMVSLLRMEMFGCSEREWKSDERQVAVDILRLGEIVYRYFTDEWRFRLPALRDVRNWLSQSHQMINDEDENDL